METVLIVPLPAASSMKEAITGGERNVSASIKKQARILDAQYCSHERQSFHPRSCNKCAGLPTHGIWQVRHCRMNASSKLIAAFHSIHYIGKTPPFDGWDCAHEFTDAAAKCSLASGCALTQGTLKAFSRPCWHRIQRLTGSRAFPESLCRGARAPLSSFTPQL